MGARQRIFQNAFKLLRSSGLGRVMAPFTQGCGAIFMMHHVRPARDDEYQPNLHLEITPEFLRQSIEQIRGNGYEIIALDEAVDLLKSGYGNQRYAALTFDDGYRDNLKIAYPILKELNVPFTIYVATGLVDRETELWWIALERIIGQNDEIRLSGETTGEAISCRTVAEKDACYEQLTRWLTQEVDEKQQRQIIRQLAERYDFDLADLADEMMMTWDELRELAQDPLVTLAAHTHAHHALARLGAADARSDIQRGIERMQQELGRKPKHFAYPYGNKIAVSKRDAQILSEAGFNSAVTTFPGLLKSVNARNPMLLPRVSLNGRFQDPYVIDQYLTGAPFALYHVARWACRGRSFRSGVSRLFPSTR
ncbi:polysaccharide deacetylase [Roseibium polysiphoniae]|uniref:Chitooligosaccharide deacetylase n=2 Tax=Roseibium polysiphoniae TaxID=2571221 RepID=A0A944CB38_9HYPH|nr:polysaccharide deacetylase [Roseibium polysiphoniae]